MGTKNVLIVCWDFMRPHAIGGRRWNKFAKSLIKSGYSVSVICSHANSKSGDKLWIEPQYLDKIKVYELQPHTLTHWLNDYSSALKSLKIRAAKFLLGWLYKGTIFDKAIGIEKQFIKLASEVIPAHAIKTVFVTGAPFNLVYYTARLREVFPDIKILADYRDPWLDAQNYGMKSLQPSKKREEQDKQNYVFEKANYITAPNSFLLEEIRQTHTGIQPVNARFVELPHAFDPDDVLPTSEKKNKKNIRIVYAGTLYIGIEQSLTLLNAAITVLKKELPGSPVEVVFYTNETKQQFLFADNKDHVVFFKGIGEKIFHEIVEADYVLMLLSEHNKNYVTSKFFEFLPYRKPYLYVGPEGFVSSKIVSEQFGYHLKNERDLFEVIRNNAVSAETKLPELRKYTFDEITKKLLQDISEN